MKRKNLSNSTGNIESVLCFKVDDILNKVSEEVCTKVKYKVLSRENVSFFKIQTYMLIDAGLSGRLKAMVRMDLYEIMKDKKDNKGLE